MNNKDDRSAGDDSALAKRASELFDESVQSLDGQARSRLNRSRQAALSEIKSGHGFQALSPWVPATGVAAAAILAVVLWNGQAPLDDIAPVAEATDFEILLDDNSFEMLQDLEFYSWIDLEVEMDVSKDSNVG